MLTNEFISECMSGSEEAVRLLVRTHQRAIFQLALSVLDRTDAPIDETVEQAELATRDAFLTASTAWAGTTQARPSPSGFTRS